MTDLPHKDSVSGLVSGPQSLPFTGLSAKGELRSIALPGRREGPRDHRSSLMNVGRRVDYALRAMCYLAAQPSGSVVTRSEIQSRQGVPQHYLSKILRRLVSARLLESSSGARGGFRLGRPAEEISVRDVYECVEGNLCLIECLHAQDEEEFCCFASVCTQREIWRGAQKVLLDYLSGISIAKMADPQGLVNRLEATGGRTASRPRVG